MDWSGAFVAALAVLAVLGTAVASLLWFRLLERNALSRLNTFTFLTPLFALTIGILFFGERPGPVQWAGTALVLTAAVLAGRSRPATAESRGG